MTRDLSNAFARYFVGACLATLGLSSSLCQGRPAVAGAASAATGSSAPPGTSSSTTSGIRAGAHSGAVITPVNVAVPSASPVKGMRPPARKAPTPMDVPTIVERYSAAVVNISAADQQTVAVGLDGIDAEDPVYPFFRRALQQPQEVPPGAPRVSWGSGSGFIISPDGVVLTTSHVVGRADEVTVKLTDRREFKAKVVAVDPQSDAALLQIEGATNLPVVKLGDSARVRPGEPLVTIGAPDGPDNAVTAGLLSATTRTLSDGSPFPFFQTDLAVNPDNSGGPVFNRLGEVIGIAVQIYGDGDRYQTQTFAIPINTALTFRKQSLVSTKTSHGSLGIEVQDIDPGLAAAFGLPRAAGALVTSVSAAPASRTAVNAIKPGDVITQISGKTIDRSAELLDYAANLEPGTKVMIKLVRNKRPMAMTVPVGVSEETQAARPASTVSAGSMAERIGLAVHSLSDADRRASGYAGGLMVEGTAGAAAIAGIQPGDLLLSVNGTPVASREELDTLIAKSGKEIALLIQRDGARSFVSLEVK